MSNISLKCVDQNLFFLTTPNIYSGDVNYDTVDFDFCSTWSGFTKTAVFYRNKDEVYYQLLDDNNACTIPKEVLVTDGVFYLGVFGVKGDKVKTTQILPYKVREGTITEDLVTPDPTPDIFEQLLSKYNEYIKELNEKVTTAIANTEKAIDNTNEATEDCREAIKSLETEVFDINGGTPSNELKEG